MIDGPGRVRQEQAEEFVNRARRQRGMLLLVSGSAGMGKTYFLRSIGQRTGLDERGNSACHYVYADEFELHLPYSFIERLLASGLSDDTSVNRFDSPVDVARKVLRAMVEAPYRTLRTILIDDAQWIDEESVRVLRYIAPRVVQQDVFLVFAERSPYRENSLAEFLSTFAETSPLHEHYLFEPLTVKDVQGYSVERFGTSIPNRTAESIVDVTNGTFLGLEHVFAGVTPSEVSTLHLTWDLQIRASSLPADPLLRTYEALQGPAQVAVQIASLAFRDISLRSLARVAAEMGEETDVGQACTADILRQTRYGSYVMVAHRLIGRAVKELVEPNRARRIYQALAGVTEGYDALAYALRGAEEWSEPLGDRVDDFVTEAVADGNFRLAQKILRASLNLAEGTVRDRLLETLGLLNMRTKSAFEILDLLPDFEALRPSMIRDSIVVLLRFYLFEEDASRRLAELLHQQIEDPNDRTIQSFLAFLAGLMGMRSKNPDQVAQLMPLAQQLWAQAPEEPQLLDDQRLAWMVAPQDYQLIVEGYSIVSLHLSYQMDATAELASQLMGRLAQRPASSHKADAIAPVAGALVALGKVRTAHQLMSETVRMLPTVEKPWAIGTVWTIHLHTLVLLGRFSEARMVASQLRELTDDFLDVEHRLTLAALRAWLAAVTQTEDPEPYLAESQRLGDVDWEHYGVDFRVMAECEIARTRGNPQDVITVTEPDRVDHLRNTQRGFLTYRAHALIDLNRLEDAEALIGHLKSQRGRQWQEMWGSLAGLQARLAQAWEQNPEAEQFYQEAVREDFVSPLVEALTRVDYGAFLAQGNWQCEAQTQLRTAAELLSRIGATAYLPRVTSQLATLEDRKQLEHMDRLSGLTVREMEVARHLADGHSNKRIADALFVSQATVRSHVSNVLRKLEITSRAEVARVFRGPGDLQSASGGNNIAVSTSTGLRHHHQTRPRPW